jgi:hypothetical protein
VRQRNHRGRLAGVGGALALGGALLVRPTRSRGAAPPAPTTTMPDESIKLGDAEAVVHETILNDGTPWGALVGRMGVALTCHWVGTTPVTKSLMHAAPLARGRGAVPTGRQQEKRMKALTVRHVCGAALLAGVVGLTVVGVRILHQGQTPTTQALVTHRHLATLRGHQRNAIALQTARDEPHGHWVPLLLDQGRTRPIQTEQSEGQR